MTEQASQAIACHGRQQVRAETFPRRSADGVVTVRSYCFGCSWIGDDAATEANAFGSPRPERTGRARTIMAARLGRMGRTPPGASVCVKISATVRLTVRTACPVKISLPKVARCAIVHRAAI